MIRTMILFYSFTLFLSSFLLFSIQPLVGKMLLPLFGGTPAVWNICMVFFQAMLLGGYFYASALVKIKTARKQWLLHLLLLMLAITYTSFFPLQSFVTQFASNISPSFSLLLILSKSIGFLFILLSASATLLQSWFAKGHVLKGHDPYFLYSASNFGSLLALLIYPFLIEPYLNLTLQFQIWTGGLLFLGFCIFLSALMSEKNWKKQDLFLGKFQIQSKMTTKLYWLLLSLIPSSLLIALTTYLTTEVASFPLLWVIPLSLYLVSFVVVFSNRGRILTSDKYYNINARLISFTAALILLGVILTSNKPFWLFLPLHLSLFFLICTQFHGQLAKVRPQVNELPNFYLWLSLGGVLGGILSSLIAPLIFTEVMEYPLIFMGAIGLGSFFIKSNWTWKILIKDFLFAGALGLLTAVLVPFGSLISLTPEIRLLNLLVLVIPVLINYRFVKQPRRYALALLAIYFSNYYFFSKNSMDVLYRERTFFGTIKVVEDLKGKFIMLYHGTTLHGQQSKDFQKSMEPLTYYSRTGPVGDVFEFARRDIVNFKSVGIVGLGAGTLSVYAKPTDLWTFYELDPAILKVALEPKYFSFLKNQGSVFPNHVPNKYQVGDARLKLREAQAFEYDLLVIDAFSSDSIPTHLLTKEAMELYWEKLNPKGMLAVHISNRYFDFKSLLNGLSKEVGAKMLFRTHEVNTDADLEKSGMASSSWVVIVKDQTLLSDLLKNPQWKMHSKFLEPLWTDMHSDLFSLFKK